MNVSVQKTHDKGVSELNEDDLLIKNNLFAVFDGAGSLVDYKNKEGLTGGKLASAIVKKVFSKNKKPLNQLAKEANKELLEKMEKEGIDTNHKEALWSTGVAAVRITGNEIEFFNITDCLILAILKDGSCKLLGKYIDHDEESLVKWKMLADKKVKGIHEKLKTQIEKVRRTANIKYGVLNGDPMAESFFNYGKIKSEWVKSIILLTDGVFLPKKNPKEPENWKLFVELYRKAGLKGILKYIRSLENSDPNCWKYPRFKKHDDATAIAIDFD